LSKALLAHMFSYNIQWGATKKEVERSNFFIEVPRIIKRFRIALVLCILMLGAMAVLATNVVPEEWRMPAKADWAILLPLVVTCGSHILFPVRSPFRLYLISFTKLATIDRTQPLVDDFLILSNPCLSLSSCSSLSYSHLL
jgi:hypothetical protein